VARAILLKPDMLFLDEATSALDAAMEAKVYQLLHERLPDAAIISIAHNPSVVAFHDRRLVIDPAARRLHTAPMALAG
jgi:putative ATP-binding cassette transporter